MLAVLLATLVLTGCDDSTSINVGGCSYSGTIDGPGVTLDGSRTTPGGSLDVDGGGADNTPSTPCDSQRFGDCQFWISAPPAAAVTMSDVAHFAPSVGTHGMEPAGWAVTGIPTNIFATTPSQTLAGTVLGTPAEVHFAPVAWHWDYGDGGASTLGTGGATWSALGVGEFTPTATSHVFTRRGAYVITLTVEFTAQYRVGAGQWVRIPGTLPREAPPLRVLSRGASTVLVDENCRSNPRGPGC